MSLSEDVDLPSLIVMDLIDGLEKLRSYDTVVKYVLHVVKRCMWFSKPPSI